MEAAGTPVEEGGLADVGAADKNHGREQSRVDLGEIHPGLLPVILVLGLLGRGIRQGSTFQVVVQARNSTEAGGWSDEPRRSGQSSGEIQRAT